MNEPFVLAHERGGESCSSHHATAEVGLEFLRVHVRDIQNVELSLGTVQDSLAVQHALLKVSWLLEQLVLCGDLSQFPLRRVKREILEEIALPCFLFF